MRTEKERKVMVATFFLIVIQAVLAYRWYRNRRDMRFHLTRAPYRNRDMERNALFERLFQESDRVCHDQLRMNRRSFQRLCARLCSYGLVNMRSVSVEEQVAIFLNIVGHDHRNCSTVLQFFRSGQTVSHYFHLVLDAVLRMYKDVVKAATLDNSSRDGGNDEDWHHYFGDAVGAIDGTHFHANVPLADQARYRNRNGIISQNVLVACTFNMKFTYVLAGWEGSAHDGRLLRCAVSRDGRRLTLPQGKYYLADAGFANVPGFLTPYRGVRYHLREKKDRVPENAKELYNFRHSSLRNVVERIIGVLKKRFVFLRNATFHDVQTQSKIILACCALHNFLRDEDPEDLYDESDDESLSDEENENQDDNHDEDHEHLIIATTPQWTTKRNALCDQMWNDYIEDSDE